jgi:ferric-dicitrate binding protein FerR (iron transport regulator)
MSWYRFRYGDSPEPNAARAPRDVSTEAYETEDDVALREQLSNPDDADYALITDFLAGELSPDDRARVEERLRTDARFRALAEPLIMIWNVPGPLDRPEDLADRVEAERRWKMLKRRIELEEAGVHTPTLEEKHRRRRNRRRTVFSTVTVLIAGLLIKWMRPQLIPIPSMSMHADAPVYEERSAKLPDETQVTLVPGSHLSWDPSFSATDKRTLNLAGEATFTIGPGQHRTLIVDGAGVEVRASEGRFTVHSFDGEPIAYVQVHEGSAEVRARTLYAGGETLRLNAGEGVRVGPGVHIDRVNVITPNSVRIK